MNETGPLRIACAAGFSGDRTDAAEPLVRELRARGDGGFLVFETLAERTLALAQLARRIDPGAGFEPLLRDMLRPVLKECVESGIRIIGNFGAANPRAAGQAVVALARELGVRVPRVAIVSGDDLLQSNLLHKVSSTGGEQDQGEVVSANAYIGARAIAGALREGADVVVCGRIADPSLVVGPAIAHFGLSEDDLDMLAAATMTGHLLECGAQVTGGYFADGVDKHVPDLDRVGYPIAELWPDGRCVISKPPDTGGRIDRHTVIEQLLYEVHDPAAYVTPDVVADLSRVSVKELGANVVEVAGFRGQQRPATLKVNICRARGWLAEGEISYAGPTAESRARLAADILRKRLPGLAPLRVDLIGVASVFGDDGNDYLARLAPGDARDLRLRVAAFHRERSQATLLAREVTALYTCGPAGGGGIRTAVTQRLSTHACFIPREEVAELFSFLEAKP